jgi:hypothetical protein
MARIRLSTTVDSSLLEAARVLHSGSTDAARRIDGSTLIASNEPLIVVVHGTF